MARHQIAPEMLLRIRQISLQWQQIAATRYAASSIASSLQNSEAQDARSVATRESNKLDSLARQPFTYLATGLQDAALEVMNLAQLYEDADEGMMEEITLGHSDHLVKALLKWFKSEFFQWVNAPACSICQSETDFLAMVEPTQQEKQLGAGRTESYRCKQDQSHIERFPRYDDVRTLLTWRKGRCGEWANCFTLLCIALGIRARWVYNYEDHVWTEVYSKYQKRWIHCDACENAFDAPLIYASGWGKKMSHCVAFSVTGAMDVSRRYIREPDQRLPAKVSADTMSDAIKAINTRLRATMSPEERAQYIEEDVAEEAELASYVNRVEPTKPEELAPRESGSAEWKDSRGESGKKA